MHALTIVACMRACMRACAQVDSHNLKTCMIFDFKTFKMGTKNSDENLHDISKQGPDLNTIKMIDHTR